MQITKPSDIGLWIDKYDDIFSDFDPRPYSERALSDDFLNEARKASRDKVCGQIELKFMIAEKERDLKLESQIKKRLRNHFMRHHQCLVKDQQKMARDGRNLLVLGIVIMLCATYLNYNFQAKSLLVSFILVIFEPAGWFLFWSGGDRMLFEPKKYAPELEFYEKMSKSDISFVSLN